MKTPDEIFARAAGYALVSPHAPDDQKVPARMARECAAWAYQEARDEVLRMVEARCRGNVDLAACGDLLQAEIREAFKAAMGHRRA